MHISVSACVCGCVHASWLYMCVCWNDCFHWLSWPVCALITEVGFTIVYVRMRMECVVVFCSKSLSGLKRCDGFTCMWDRRDLLKTVAQHLQLYCDFACFTNLIKQDKSIHFTFKLINVFLFTHILNFIPAGRSKKVWTPARLPLCYIIFSSDSTCWHSGKYFKWNSFPVFLNTHVQQVGTAHDQSNNCTLADCKAVLLCLWGLELYYIAEISRTNTLKQTWKKPACTVPVSINGAFPIWCDYVQKHF